jgi:hypothetical protein
VFEIPDGQPLNPDMTLVEGDASKVKVKGKKTKTPAKPKAQPKAPETFSELAKIDSKAMTAKGDTAAAGLV